MNALLGRVFGERKRNAFIRGIGVSRILHALGFAIASAVQQTA